MITSRRSLFTSTQQTNISKFSVSPNGDVPLKLTSYPPRSPHHTSVHSHHKDIPSHFPSRAVTLEGTLDAALSCFITVTWPVPSVVLFFLAVKFISHSQSSTASKEHSSIPAHVQLLQGWAASFTVHTLPQNIYAELIPAKKKNCSCINK